jgi:pyridinium-3,5-biscarboxylic acid mononucleotide sulfurtransferase
MDEPVNGASANLPAGLQAKLGRVCAMFAPMDAVLVAFSGGVDSTLVLKLAHQVLGDRVLALTTTSPTMPDEDRESALAMARMIGARHLVIESNELEIPGYAANPINRCYLCKTNLFTICEAKAAELGIGAIVDGLNLDDLSDYRPGMRAAGERHVRHPLVEAELTKAEVRELSRALGLPTWDRAASPCLSSRFPYGTEITPEGLTRVAAGERALHALGFKVARVRYHGDVARIEVEQSEIARLLETDTRAAVDRALRSAGFRFVTVDLRGFRSGSLNEGVAAAADTPSSSRGGGAG